MTYKEHTECRVCGNQKLIPYIDLGMMPLSNNLCDNHDEEAERYPLKVLLCTKCGLSQLSIVIPPEVMFSHYVYRSSISQGYKDHCREMAISLKEKHGLNENSFHIDIAGNDGALLAEFKKVVNSRMLNIDPAENLVAINEAQGIRQFTAFWGINAAIHLDNTSWPKADLITATNVFAHVDNVKDFIYSAKLVLSPTGVLVLEFPYLINFIENKEFDTIYFEHLSYFSIYPITLLCQQVGLQVLNVEPFDIHGGSVRVTIGYGTPDLTVSNYVISEAKYRNIDPYQEFAEDVHLNIGNFRKNILDLVYDGHSVSGFAASAKGNTLLNSAGISKCQMDFIFDETVEKIGKFSPGTRIPILGLKELTATMPDYLVILSWNFKDAIIKKCREAGYKGQFIIPIPKFEICH